MDLYVYYKVRTSDAQAFGDRAREWLKQLSADYGVAASLSRRPEAKDGLHTWMEVFPQAGEPLELDLDRRMKDFGLDTFICGERRVERFLRVL